VLEFRSCAMPAFDGRNLRLAGDLSITDTHVGRIDLFGARIGGQLWLNNSHVDGCGGGYGISAPQIEVAGGFYARGLTVRSGLNLWGADIRAGLELHGATLAGGERKAFRAPHLTVVGDVTLADGARVSGAVDLSSVTVHGRLMLDYRVDDLHQVVLSESRIRALQLEIVPAEHVGVDLNGAVVTSLRDSVESWPKVLKLDRTTYDTLRPLLPARERLEWLERNQDSNSPQPYEQLARQYRDAGHDHDTRTILLAKYRNRTRRQRLPLKAWGYLQDATVGYGYRPLRALAWLAGLTLVVGICTTLWHLHSSTSTAPDFNAVIYALDVVLPILDLGQEKTYSAAGPGSVVVWTAILGGWLLASTVIASITRTISRS